MPVIRVMINDDGRHTDLHVDRVPVRGDCLVTVTDPTNITEETMENGIVVGTVLLLGTAANAAKMTDYCLPVAVIFPDTGE